MVTAAAILAQARASRIREVTVSGQTLHVRKLSGAERSMIGERARAKSPFRNHEIVALAACEPDGSALFTAEEAAELDELDGGFVEALVTEILQAAGILEKAVETALKNSEATPNA